MSESFSGRYILTGPKIYIKPHVTRIIDDGEGVPIWDDLPAGIWIWVECNPEDTGIKSHWVDIQDLIEAYGYALQEWSTCEYLDYAKYNKDDPDNYPR